MHPRYPHVFSPIKLGPVEIDNRFYFAPHGVSLSLGGEPSDDFPYYSAERVTGGCGLVINALHLHEKNARCSPYPERFVRSFEAMAQTVHRAGGRIFGELLYFWGSAGQWQPMGPPRPAFGATASQLNGSHQSMHAMSRQELRDVVAAHGRAASHMRRAGYHGIEVHMSHGTLLEQMVSPYFNRRTDEYGGSLENRLRFALECLEATRDGAGDGMAVGIRFNCDELLPGGYGQSDAREILSRLCGSGLVDFADLDVAVEPNQFWLGMPPVFVDPQPYRPYVEAVRSAAGDVPVLSVLGRLTTVAQAEEAIAAGVCDMVGAARALIAEPHLVRHARDGHEERSRTCIACNYCMAAAHVGAAGCSINPASYRERQWGERTFAERAATPSKVVVVGGGPGGLEAARVAARKGHDVVLLEARDALGGALRTWATIPGRETFQKGVDWWSAELDRRGVDVRLGVDATAETVLAEQPDAVIVATGARYSTTGRSGFLDVELEGHDRADVLVPEDVLERGARPQGKVVLLDGEGLHTGVGIAEILAGAGAQVEFVTPAFAPVAPDLMASVEVGFIVRRLKDAGVMLSTSTWARRIGERRVTLYDVFTSQERMVEDVSAVVLVTSRVPHDPLTAELEGRVAQLFTIGDALAARPMAAASYEGQMFARFIGEPDAPSTFSEAYWPELSTDVLARPAAALLDAPAVL